MEFDPPDDPLLVRIPRSENELDGLAATACSLGPEVTGVAGRGIAVGVQADTQ